jgi:uncharacterized membrane protein YhaH (DUF805 family)
MFWRVYFSSQGRMGRAGYWFASLGIVVLTFVLIIISELIVTIALALDVHADASTRQAELAGGSGWAIMAVLILMLVMAGNVGVKRAHDRGQTGQLYIAYLCAIFALSALRMVGFEIFAANLPIGQLAAYGAQLYFFVVFGFLGGDQGANKYGPDPREAGRDTEPPVKIGPPI